MEKSQIVILVEREALLQFRAACILRETTPTREVARLIQEQLRQWQEESTAIREKPLRQPRRHV